MKRNIYSDDFKKQAVTLFRQVGISKACKVVRVTRATLYRWNETYDKDDLGCGDMMNHRLGEKETIVQTKDVK